MKLLIENLVGKKYNKLTIISEGDRHLEPNGKKQRTMNCICECGNKTNVQLRDLRSKRPIKSCGCVNGEQKIDIKKENKYGKLTIIKEVLEYVSPNGHTSRKVLCSCECGNKKEIILNSLRSRSITNCGCIVKPKEIKIRDILPLNIKEINKKDFGSWVVLSEESFYRNKDNNIERNIIAQCSCGFIKHTTINNMVRGSKKCFECSMRYIKDSVSKEDRYIKYLLRGRLSGMKRRCLNPDDKFYQRYGGRGIKICENWLKSFDSFYQWAISNGFKKELQIDRIDNNGNYEPNNCRFVTHLENQMNRGY